MTEIKQVDPERILTAPSDRLAIGVLTDKLNEAITLINAQQKELELLRGHIHELGDIDDILSGEPLVEGENNEGQAVWTIM